MAHHSAVVRGINATLDEVDDHDGVEDQLEDGGPTRGREWGPTREQGKRSGLEWDPNRGTLRIEEHLSLLYVVQ